MHYMATRNGLEPSTSSVTGWRANRLHHRAKYGGGNNRARTCDLLLVRQMLSQLSYAPELAFGVAHLSDVAYYTQYPPFCQAFFLIFFVLFFGAFFLLFQAEIGKNQILFSSSFTSSGVKVYTVSQNWHSTGKGFPSSMIWVSSSRPRLIRALSTRCREQ